MAVVQHSAAQLERRMAGVAASGEVLLLVTNRLSIWQQLNVKLITDDSGRLNAINYEAMGIH